MTWPPSEAVVIALIGAVGVVLAEPNAEREAKSALGYCALASEPRVK